MKAINLYKFVQKNQCEYNWDGENVILFINAWNIKEFCDLLGSRSFDDDAIDVKLKYGYICVYMKDICEMADIELTEIFEK